MTIENPYQSPRSRTEMDNSQDCRREGKYAFVPKGRDLPPRCIICNAEAATPIKQKTMYWHSPWLYFLILLNILIYAFIAIFVRKKTKVSPGYCKAHRSARRKKIYSFLGGSLLFVCGGMFLVANQEPAGALAFVVAFLLLIPAIIISNRFRPVSIDNSGAKFAGCQEPFLDSLK